MTDRLVTDLGPGPLDHEWRAAQAALAGSDLRIGHIDTGLFPHPTLGYQDDAPPANILLSEGANVFDPETSGGAPVTDLSTPGDRTGEFPDHGVKTLSVILANRPGKLVGVAPGAKIVPYRVANGPVFIGRAKTSAIGAAMDHAMALATPPRVFSISMGNPGALAFVELARVFTGGSPGMAAETAEAVNAAYEAGIVTVAAGGQIINNVSYPARFARVIAVGGVTADDVHYPIGGYDNADLIDIWARASPINRAAGVLRGGKIVPTHADDEADEGGEPSGTSYATPQVSGAAALWLHRYAAELAAFAVPWMIVESFRHALRTSARKETIRLSRHRPDRVAIRRLDVESLLRTPPDGAARLRKRDRATRFESLF